MAELGGGFALQELHVVDQQQVDAAEPLLEAERRLALHGGDEVVHEMVGRQVDDVPARLGRSGGPGDGVEQVGFAEADARMDIDRIEADGVVGGRMGHLFCDLQRHLVGRADDEAVEGHFGVERRARQRVAAAAPWPSQVGRLPHVRGARARSGHRPRRFDRSWFRCRLAAGCSRGRAWPLTRTVKCRRDEAPDPRRGRPRESSRRSWTAPRRTEETGGHAQVGEIVDDLFEFHAARTRS
jgi:hypothetical protein